MKATLVHVAGVTGALSLGILSVLHARIFAFSDGTFSYLSWVALCFVAACAAACWLGPKFGQKVLGKKLAQASPPRHASMLAHLAAETARGRALDLPLLSLGAVLVLSSALPLASMFVVVGGGSEVNSRDAQLLFATMAFGSGLLPLLMMAQPSIGAKTYHRCGAGVLLCLGWTLGALLSSRLGPPVVGLNEYAALCVVLSAAVAIPCVGSARLQRWYGPLVIGIVILAAGRGATYTYSKLDDAYERLTPEEGRAFGERFSKTIENRYGVVTITPSGWIHQNGRVQGVFNTSPIPAADVNRCARAYVIPATFPGPLEILMLGLGSGSFAQILAHHPNVQRLVVVESNPAYLEAVENSGQIASLPTNPKVTIVEGHPSRVLHAQGKFDLIIVDRLPFRSEPNVLVTKEGLSELSQHLQANGALYVNTLQRPEIERALVESFPYLLRYQDMVFASKTRLRVDGYQWMRDLMSWSIDGHSVLATDKDPTEVARHIVKNRDFRGAFAWEREDAIDARTKKATPLSDTHFPPAWWLLETLP